MEAADDHIKEPGDFDELPGASDTVPLRYWKRKYTDTKKKERKRLRDKKQAERRIRISLSAADINRWADLKTQLGLENHRDVVTFLLNWFELTSPHPVLANDVQQLIKSSYPRHLNVATDTIKSVQFGADDVASEERTGVQAAAAAAPVAVLPDIEILESTTIYHRIDAEERQEGDIQTDSGSSDIDVSDVQSNASSEYGRTSGQQEGTYYVSSEVNKDSWVNSQDYEQHKDDRHTDDGFIQADSARQHSTELEKERDFVKGSGTTSTSYYSSKKVTEREQLHDTSSQDDDEGKIEDSHGHDDDSDEQVVTEDQNSDLPSEGANPMDDASEALTGNHSEGIVQMDVVSASGRPRRKASLGINKLLSPWWKSEEFGCSVSSGYRHKKTVISKVKGKVCQKVTPEHNYAFGGDVDDRVVYVEDGGNRKKKELTRPSREYEYLDVFESSSGEDDDDNDKDFLPEEKSPTEKDHKKHRKYETESEVSDEDELRENCQSDDEHEDGVHGNRLTEEDLVTQLKAYEEHIKRLPNGQDACRLCTQKFKTRSRRSLLHHFMLHNEGELSCRLCGFVAATKSGMISHRLSHGDKTVACDLCQYTTYTNRALEAHKIRSHTPDSEKNLVCTWEDCTEKFALKCDLRKHIRSHSNPGGFVCHICGKVFNSQRSVRIHIKSVHEKDPDESKIICELCGKQYARSSAHVFKLHMRKHNNEKPFKCKFCGKAFVSSQFVRDHERTHTGEKPYTCKHCDFRAAKRAQVQSHMKTHTGIKPFKCNLCEYASSWNIQLKTHMKAHGSPTEASCLICRIAFINQKSLNIHNKKTHLAKNSYFAEESAPLPQPECMNLTTTDRLQYSTEGDSAEGDTLPVGM
ncbi:uncharacterized protein [Ptychodera flava]|uniref:uncharacterized protein n=1 Tax=Ptychodera flava TaxID=63121 RepID=UPI00396A0ABD